MHGAIVGATFGRERFGAILGLMRPAMFPIQILGVPFAGWVYDVYQSYDPAFQVFWGCTCLRRSLSPFIARQKKWQRLSLCWWLV